MAKPELFPTPKTFAELVTAVRAALIAGQARADRVYLESYHTTGFLIDAHILFLKARTGYGEQVIPQLAHAINASDRLLYRCLKFVREYPILPHGAELGWSHYRLLLEVANKAERKALESAARKNHWTGPELELRVREANAINVTPTAAGNGGATPTTHKPLVPQRGTPGICKVIADGDRVVVDLGFACYLDLPDDTEFKPGALVSLDAAGRVAAAPDATKADLFNYRVEIIKVVDGDTLWVKIHLRPRQWLKQKLRLRGLDCPEMNTPEGKAAKRFVDALVAKTTAVTINTTKPDKYDRYLADVFLVGATDQSSEASAKEDIFLNNALLENGQAVRKDEWEFGIGNLNWLGDGESPDPVSRRASSRWHHILTEFPAVGGEVVR